MIIIDTSAWIEYFRGGEPSVMRNLFITTGTLTAWLRILD